ncbi:MAG: indole-3-glycerol phosphate synthase TrpC [Thermodesulfovibrionales bacterium]
MTTTLQDILFKKRLRLQELKAKKDPEGLKKTVLKIKRNDLRDFKKAIKRGTDGIRFIGEIKAASPSKGIIRKDIDLLKIASIYEQKVDAISVITEEDFFLGRLSYLEDIKKVVTRPVLRKDFIIDEYQIYESYLSGADAILLIASILDREQSERFLSIAKELGMSVLYEIHNEEELEKALEIKAEIIGINNRDLMTMNIDLNTTLRLKPLIPSEKIVVSESGIKSREHVRMLEEAGIDAVLVGTVLMEASDIGARIDSLRKD